MKVKRKEIEELSPRKIKKIIKMHVERPNSTTWQALYECKFIDFTERLVAVLKGGNFSES